MSGGVPGSSSGPAPRATPHGQCPRSTASRPRGRRASRPAPQALRAGLRAACPHVCAPAWVWSGLCVQWVPLLGSRERDRECMGYARLVTGLRARALALPASPSLYPSSVHSFLLLFSFPLSPANGVRSQRWMRASSGPRARGAPSAGPRGPDHVRRRRAPYAVPRFLAVLRPCDRCPGAALSRVLRSPCAPKCSPSAGARRSCSRTRARGAQRRSWGGAKTGRSPSHFACVPQAAARVLRTTLRMMNLFVNCVRVRVCARVRQWSLSTLTCRSSSQNTRRGRAHLSIERADSSGPVVEDRPIDGLGEINRPAEVVGAS